MSAKDVIVGTLHARLGPVVFGNERHAERLAQRRNEAVNNQADAILSALTAAGYAVVPREPTEAMIRRVNAACDEPDAELGWTWPVWLAAAEEPMP